MPREALQPNCFGAGAAATTQPLARAGGYKLCRSRRRLRRMRLLQGKEPLGAGYEGFAAEASHVGASDADCFEKTACGSFCLC
jgi:hypothetical protein